MCPTGGKVVDVVVRVEQDYRLGPDGDDRRDGVGYSCQRARAPKGARKAGLPPRGRANRGGTSGATRGGKARADRAPARQRRPETRRATRQGLQHLPYLQQGRTEQDWSEPLGCYRGGDCRSPELSVLYCVAGGQRSKMGPGKAEPVAL